MLISDVNRPRMHGIRECVTTKKIWLCENNFSNPKKEKKSKKGLEQQEHISNCIKCKWTKCFKQKTYFIKMDEKNKTQPYAAYKKKYLKNKNIERLKVK